MVRPDWINLNGTWEYQTDRMATGTDRKLWEPTAAFTETIEVPFCRESELSGIGDKEFCNCVWYRKRITIPAEWAGKRILLHVGACDYKTTLWVDGKEVGYLPSVADMERRLQLFLKIADSWGMKKPFKGFVNPGGIMYSDDSLVEEMSKVLYKYGVRYWADPFLSWGDDPTVLKVYNGVACFRWKRNPAPMPWDAWDLDPDRFCTVNHVGDRRRSCLHGSHWTNFLRFYPEHNGDYIPAWERFYKRQGEIWGSVNSETLAEAVNQTFYHQFAVAEEKDGAIIIDLSEVERNKLDCHKNEFVISFRHGVEPKGCEGGEIRLCEKHEEFDVYKVIHGGARIVIKF